MIMAYKENSLMSYDPHQHQFLMDSKEKKVHEIRCQRHQKFLSDGCAVVWWCRWEDNFFCRVNVKLSVAHKPDSKSL